jgi:hypothetical protein
MFRKHLHWNLLAIFLIKTESHLYFVSSQAPPKSFLKLHRIKRLEKSTEINQYHLYLSIFKSFLGGKASFKCFPFSYLLSRDCKTTVTHMQIFNLSGPQWDESPQTALFFITPEGSWQCDNPQGFIVSVLARHT